MESITFAVDNSVILGMEFTSWQLRRGRNRPNLGATRLPQSLKEIEERTCVLYDRNRPAASACSLHR
jgi:hypothetical protein